MDTFHAQIRVQLADAEAMLEALEGSHIHLGAPFDGRSEAKMHHLRHQIAEYKAILDRSSSAA